MQRISEWLAELNPWEIYDNIGLTADFIKETGLSESEACWPSHTVKQTIKEMKERGLGGSIEMADITRRVAHGHEIAEALARKFVKGYSRSKTGRGSAFNEALDSLRQAGL